MSESVQEFMKRYQAFCEVAPYYVVFEERPPHGGITRQRIQAGFDIDVYGVKRGLAPGPLSDYAFGFAAVSQIARAVEGELGESCSIEVIPFTSTVVLDTRRQFQPEGMVRVRVTHTRGIGQPAGPLEEKAAKAVLKQLQDLGVSPGGGK